MAKHKPFSRRVIIAANEALMNGCAKRLRGGPRYVEKTREEIEDAMRKAWAKQHTE